MPELERRLNQAGASTFEEGAPFYDRAGVRIGLGAWAALIGDVAYRRIARWEHHDVEVLTSWLGVDYRACCTGSTVAGDAAPLIFVTEVVRNGRTVQTAGRYATEEGALEGHALACRQVRAEVAEGRIA